MDVDCIHVYSYPGEEGSRITLRDDYLTTLYAVLVMQCELRVVFRIVCIVCTSVLDEIDYGFPCNGNLLCVLCCKGGEGSAMATAVRPPRPGRARAALADVTNTSSVKAQKGRAVAKCRSTVREVAVEASKHDHLDANLKKSRGKAPTNQVVVTPSSPERSNATAAKDISVVKLVVRGRKAKEQVQLEPKFGDVESKKKNVVQKPKVKVAQAGGSKPTKKIVKETQTSEEEFNGDQHESDACEHEKQEAKASERSVAQKQVASSLAESDSSKLTKRRREPAKAKKSRAAESSQEVSKDGEASPSSVQATGDQNLDTSVSEQVRDSESVQKTKVAGKRGSVAISSSKERRAATGSVRQGRRVPVKPQIQEDMERAVAQVADDKAARNAHLQTPVAGGDLRMADGLTDDVVVENLAKGKKGTGKGIAKADDLSLTLKRVTSASRHESFLEGLVRGTHSVTKVTRGISAELPQVPISNLYIHKLTPVSNFIQSHVFIKLIYQT